MHRNDRERRVCVDAASTSLTSTVVANAHWRSVLGSIMPDSVVYLVDDDALSRETLAALLAVDGYRVVCFGTAEEFLARFDDDPMAPRCMVSDLRLPGMNGLELHARLQASGVRIPTIYISGLANIPSAVEAMKQGAVDFLEKPFERSRLVECIEKALLQDRQDREKLATRREIERRLARLTPREREVLDLLVTGHSTKGIASRLGINAKTVFVHRARVMEKMGVDSLVALSRLMMDGDQPLRSA